MLSLGDIGFTDEGCAPAYIGLFVHTIPVYTVGEGLAPLEMEPLYICNETDSRDACPYNNVGLLILFVPYPINKKTTPIF